ncbi:MAG: DUF4010 domain-containing protein [Aquabacterium sp.]|uniref:MgtC/SapB family protein n=1 Tax=Aquabacterium sp. TaxID=1872578 RepID=UPI001B4825E1|nr:DUF4010 domain-containing protein [Aquabacterium sp.]MBP7132333.1 DUF4010 domain-containing protein [Aquabacterium sp.]
MNGFSLSPAQMGLAVALGCGLLIGLERERRKGTGRDRAAAGLRTFAVVALLGAIAQIVSVWLSAVALGSVAVMAALSYWRLRDDDPGITTEVSLIATTLIGMLAVSEPVLSAACAALLAAVLAARERLHHFANTWLSEKELYDGLLLAALALVLLPLMPNEPLSWMGDLSPQRGFMLVIVILVLQAASHVAQRLLGARSGLAVSGFLGGFVSSTATISAMGSLARQRQVPLRMTLCAAILSTAATWMQIVLMILVVAPSAWPVTLPLMVLGVTLPLVLGALLWQHGSAESVGVSAQQDVLRLREALMVALLLVGGAVVVSYAQQRGVGGLLLGTALAAIADAQAPMASLLAMYGAGTVPVGHLLMGLMVALTVNSATRGTVACVSGGWRFGLVVASALALNMLMGWAWVVWTLA